MARDFDGASTQYLEALFAPIRSVPFTMACWIYNDVDTNNTVLSLADSAAGNHYFQMDYNTNQDVLAVSRAGPAGTATSAGVGNINQWVHACCVFASSTSRAAFRDGANKGTNTTASTPANINRFRIGYESDSSPALPFNGAIAEVAIWNVALSDTQVALLGLDRVSARFVQPQNLIFYAPLIASEDFDIIGNVSLTPVNSPTIFDHPPIIQPTPPLLTPIISVSAAAPVTGQPMNLRGTTVPGLKQWQPRYR